MKKLLSSLLLLPTCLLSQAQTNQRLVATSNYRLFGGTTPTIYDTCSYNYNSGRGYNNTWQFWEFDTMYQKQTVPVGTYEYKDYQAFNSSGQVSWRGHQRTSNPATANTIRNHYSYDNTGRVLLDEEDANYGGSPSWTNTARTRYYYTGVHTDSIVTEKYDVNQWRPFERRFFEYNSTELVITRYYSDYFVSGSAWMPDYRSRSHYSLGGTLLSDTTWYWYQNAWSYIQAAAYQYDANNDLVGILRYGSQYVNANFSTYGQQVSITYNAAHQKLQELTTARYPDMVWRNYTRKTWDYSGNGYPSRYTQESWDDATQQWRIYTWGSGGITSNPDEIIYYYYGFLTGVEQTDKTVATFQMFPNPASGQVTIGIPDDRHNYTQVRISDITGRTVLQQQLPPGGQCSVLLGRLAPGNYYVQLLGSQAASAVHTLTVL